MIRRRVLVAGHDIGAINVLAILLQEWAADPALETWFAGTPAVVREVRWRVPGVRIVPWAEALTEAAAANAQVLDGLFAREVQSGEWDCVLCGTSAGVALERRLLHHARRIGLPSLSYCDMWAAYEDRYRGPEGWAVPDVVLAVDERMEAEISCLPWPSATTFRAVGHPLYEQTRHRRTVPGQRGEAIRFVSEPTSSRFPSAGIDEFEVAECILQALRSTGSARRFVVRTHPVDPIEPWRRFVWRHRQDGVELDVVPLEVCLTDTWAAFGISSVLLVEMAMAGIPVASFQPVGADPAYYCLPFDEFGIFRLGDAPGIATWLETVARFVAPRETVPGDSVERVRAAILDTAASRRRIAV